MMRKPDPEPSSAGEAAGIRMTSEPADEIPQPHPQSGGCEVPIPPDVTIAGRRDDSRTRSLVAEVSLSPEPSGHERHHD